MLRFVSSLFLAGCVFAGGEPRWLRLCDKATDAPVGSRAWEDAPLRKDLLDSLKRAGWTLRREYRWENLVSAVPGTSARLPACVDDAGPVAHGIRRDPVGPVALRSADVAGVDPATQAIRKIWEAMGIESVRQALLSRQNPAGGGMTVAVIDAAFAPQHNVLQDAEIVDRWDFVEDDSLPWDSLRFGRFSDIHGTSVAGVIASRWEGLPGIAPYAKLMLYRAEDSRSESSVEEDNLAAALVRAVDSGAKIVNTSLGYRFLDANNTVAMHPWSDYDGRTLVASRAALAAARRGVLVVVSAGNEGAIGGRSIGSPADADSVLVVGAINEAGTACAFSSWGPTADGRPKPDVVGFGCDVPIAGREGVDGIEMAGRGTSFAAPAVAGLAALAWQLEPGVPAMRLLAQIKASGGLSRNPDSVRGYGLPDLRRIFPDLSRSRNMALPAYWRPENGPLVFQTSSAQGGGSLVVTLSTLDGKIVFRRSGTYQTGSTIWNPKGPGMPRPGMLVARWSGDYGAGAQTVVVLPR